MLKVRRRIMLIGWDFDARIELSDKRLPGDPRRVAPDGSPYAPWHDATSILEGPVAAAIAGRKTSRRNSATSP